MCPDELKAKDVLAALVERYQTHEITDIARMSGIPRTTLDTWQRRPDAVVRSAGRKYLSQATEHHTTTDELAAKLDKVAGLLEALLTLDREGRLGATVTHKRRAGGSA